MYVAEGRYFALSKQNLERRSRKRFFLREAIFGLLRGVFGVLSSNFSGEPSLKLRKCGGIVGGFLMVIAAGCTREVGDQGASLDAISFLSRDGVELRGTLYRVDGGPPPGLVLVHMLGSTGASWGRLGRRAQRAGIMSLAFDLRGHGESVVQNGRRISYKNFQFGNWRDVLNDIDAARKRLIEEGADAENIVIVGAGIGANLALLYAAEHRDVQGVVLLSPGLSYQGIAVANEMKELRETPSLLVACEGDAYSLASAMELHDMAPIFSELRTYLGTARGTEILESSESVIGQILQWLEGILDARSHSN